MTNLNAICHHCEQPMPASTGLTPKKYCSARCRKAAQRARAKADLPPVPAIELPVPPTNDGTWRLSGQPPHVQLETHLERIERLLDQAEGNAANGLAKTWLEGFQLLLKHKPETTEGKDAFEQALAAYRASADA